MRADIKVFAINAASRKTIILHCKYIETLYLYLNVSVERVSNRTSFSSKTLDGNWHSGIVKKILITRRKPSLNSGSFKEKFFTGAAFLF